MAECNTSPSLSGSWRGHYSYATGGESFGFEVVFIEDHGIVEGNILDDGRLGEAGVAGTFTYPKLEFTKCYYSKSIPPIKYQGTMSSDGNTLAGTWRHMAVLPQIQKIPNGILFKIPTSGTWVAKRYTDAKELDLETLDELQSQGKEKELVSTQSTRSRS